MFVRTLSLIFLVGCLGTGSEKPGFLDDDDVDGDGSKYGEDCNDDDASIHPGADEKCDPRDVDEDCNGIADNDDGKAQGAYQFYLDADGDGFGAPDQQVLLCELLPGYSPEASDCDDGDARIHPDATEVCDPNDVDEDCDGLADDADDSLEGSSRSAWYTDADADGWGAGATEVLACDAPSGTVETPGDCDDADAATHPGTKETWYDGLDTDCSGGSDYDQDGDGHDGTHWGGDDCDDVSSGVHPGVAEVWYDGYDEDCSGGSDYDQDGDGFEADTWGGDDCDDTDENLHPGAWETGAVDKDCDGVAHPTPAAVADYDSTAPLKECTAVPLDGSASADPSGGTLTYAWELIAAPAASTDTTADLWSPSDMSPYFQPTAEGDYTFELVVTNRAGVASYPDTVTITAANRRTNTAPEAAAGDDQTNAQSGRCTQVGASYTCVSCPDDTFTLDASGSSDVDYELLTATWEVISGTATLQNATSDGSVEVVVPAVEPTHGATTTSAVTLRLTITDCFGDTDTDTVTVTSTCTGS